MSKEKKVNFLEVKGLHSNGISWNLSKIASEKNKSRAKKAFLMENYFLEKA